MRELDLKAIRERVEKATPGPWRRGVPRFRCTEDHGQGSGGHGRGQCLYRFAGWWDCPHHITPDGDYAFSDQFPGPVCGTWDYEEGGVKRPEDADFIVHVRTDMPAVLDLVEAQQQRIENLEDWHIKDTLDHDHTAADNCQLHDALGWALDRLGDFTGDPEAMIEWQRAKYVYDAMHYYPELADLAEARKRIAEMQSFLDDCVHLLAECRLPLLLGAAALGLPNPSHTKEIDDLIDRSKQFQQAKEERRWCD